MDRHYVALSSLTDSERQLANVFPSKSIVGNDATMSSDSIASELPTVLEPRIDSEGMNGSMLSQLKCTISPNTPRNYLGALTALSPGPSQSSNATYDLGRTASLLLDRSVDASVAGRFSYSLEVPATSDYHSTKPWTWRVAKLGWAGELLHGTRMTMGSNTELANHVQVDRKKISTALKMAKEAREKADEAIVARILGRNGDKWLATTSFDIGGQKFQGARAAAEPALTSSNCLYVAIGLGRPRVSRPAISDGEFPVGRNAITTTAISTLEEGSQSTLRMASELQHRSDEYENGQSTTQSARMSISDQRNWTVWPATRDDLVALQTGQVIQVATLPARGKVFGSDTNFSNVLAFRRGAIEEKFTNRLGDSSRISETGSKKEICNPYPLVLLRSEDNRAMCFAKGHTQDQDVFPCILKPDVKVSVLPAVQNGVRRIRGIPGKLMIGQAFYDYYST